MSETTEIYVDEPNRIDTHYDDEPVATEHEDHERPKTARDLAMEAIHLRRQEALAKELRYGDDMENDARDQAGLPPRIVDREPEDAAEPEQEQAAERPTHREPKHEAPAHKEPTLRSINIDGNTFSVTEEQYEALAGLGARTNIALHQHQQQAQQPPQQPQQRQQSQQQYEQALTQQEAEGVAERLLYGGKEDVARTVQELSNHLMNKSRQNQVQAEQIANHATRQAIAHQQLTTDLTTISTEYPSIWQSRVLGELAAVQLGHVRQEDQATGKARTNLESYREACDRVLEALGTPRTGNGVNNNSNAQASRTVSRDDSDRSSVLSRKRAAPQQPSSALGRRTADVAATRVRTSHDIVADMRRQRHQTPE